MSEVDRGDTAPGTRREPVRVTEPAEDVHTRTYALGVTEVLNALGISVPLGASVNWEVKERQSKLKLVIVVSERLGGTD